MDACETLQTDCFYLSGSLVLTQPLLRYNQPPRKMDSSALDPYPLDSQKFGFLDPDLQKYADPRIRIQRAKYQPKTEKKILLLNFKNVKKER